jgi:hypothetical protein
VLLPLFKFGKVAKETVALERAATLENRVSYSSRAVTESRLLGRPGRSIAAENAASRAIRLSPDEFQAVAKSVRRHVDKLNRRGVGDAGQAFRDAVSQGRFDAAGTIAHNRIFKRLGSRDLRTLDGDRILVNRGPVYPGPGQSSPFGFNYRLPDLQYGRPGNPNYRIWDFKGIQPSRNFPDPTGQFRDLSDWTGTQPIALYYHWW